MIGMIVSDLDGTLLRSDKTISEYTAAIFQRCIDKGIKIAFATARPIRTVQSLNIPITFDAEIYHNGAVVHAGCGNISHYGIAASIVKDILATTFQHDLHARICMEIDDKLYGDCDVSDIWPEIEINATDFSNLPSVPADKVIVLTADIAKLKAIQSMLPEDLYLAISENTIGMIMSKKATKIHAINELCRVYHLSKSDIVAFGDDHNDVEMLQGCGIGIAVANGIHEMKTIADCVCDTNDNDGVAKWLEENVL